MTKHQVKFEQNYENMHIKIFRFGGFIPSRAKSVFLPGLLFSNPPSILVFLLYAPEQMSGMSAAALTKGNRGTYVRFFQIFQNKEFAAIISGVGCL